MIDIRVYTNCFSEMRDSREYTRKQVGCEQSDCLKLLKPIFYQIFCFGPCTNPLNSTIVSVCTHSRESLISELWRGKGSKQYWAASDLASEGKMCQYVGSLRKATHLRRMTYFYWLA